jgi:predicted house-cleaning noncanonical NTP pyrophosphatase (MazG superfamily)
MENFNLSFPIDMIKKEERIVSGIATADNIDKSGDIVEFSASLEAFKNWGGNIREMHAPVAVGKAVGFEPIEITAEDGTKYNAIKVHAYISKGAQDTWEKILDGTLKAFSIGGKIVEKIESSEKMFRGRPVNIIKQYMLGELSLVDNPANALAVVDIIKMDIDGNLDYILNIVEDIDFEKAKQPLKDPKGGLTAAGRRHFKETEGANLKPGVRGAADTPEKMRRKGSFLTRFFTNPSGPMKKPNGEPSRLALSAAAWGEPVPQNAQDAAELAAKGRRLLERYANTKEKGIEKEGEVTTGNMGAGIKNPAQGYPKKKKKESSMTNEIKKESLEEISEDSNLEELNSMNEVLKEMIDAITKTENDSELQNDINYDKVFNMNEQEINRLSLLKRVVNWLVPDVQENASAQVEVTENTQEEEMDIEILKNALSDVVDQKLETFATSIKEEIEASVQNKIDDITKGFEASTAELQEKLEATEQALTEQEEQVKAFATAGAIKKSVDPEDDEDGEELTKSAPASLWNNVYLPQGLINSLGYKS